MIVADTNLLAYLFLAGDRTGAAEDVWRTDAEWHAPLLWRSEFRNVLAVQMRRCDLTLSDAAALADEAERLLEGREHAVDATHVLRLARTSGCSAHDAEFAALAEALAVPLVSADRQLVAAFPALATSPEAFCEGGK